MAKAEEYEQINVCLYELGFILKKIGVTEFTVSPDKRSVLWDTKKEINSELLTTLCKAITKIYEEDK